MFFLKQTPLIPDIMVMSTIKRRHLMSKEKNKQKPNAKKKPQHSLKEKRQAKKEKGASGSSIWSQK
jgi:hypothetical protein